MALAIQGLVCSRCRMPIERDGLSCSACHATHHAACYRDAGHCASCLAAKEPTAFALGPVKGRLTPPSCAWIALVPLAAVLATAFLNPLLLFHCHRHHAPAAVAAPGAPEGGGDGRVQSAHAAVAAALLRPLTPSENVRPIWLDVVRHGGWVSASAERPVVTDGLGESLQFSLGGEPVSDLFVDLEVFGVPDAAARPRLAVRVARTDVDAQGVLTMRSTWTPLEPVPLFGGVKAWRRLHAYAPFNVVRMEIAGSPAGVRVHGVIGLLAGAAGSATVRGEQEVSVQKAPADTLDGGFQIAPRAGSMGRASKATVKLPGRVFTPAAPPIAGYVSHPTMALSAALHPDGELDIVTSPGGPLGISHVFSLDRAKRLAAMRRMFGEGTGEWLDGPATVALLSQWEPPWPRERIIDAATRASATLWSDGHTVLASGDGNQSVTLDGPAALAWMTILDVVDTEGKHFADGSEWTGVPGGRQILTARAMFVAPGTQHPSAEFIKALAAIEPLDARGVWLVPQRGETLELTWLPESVVKDGAKALTVVGTSATDVTLRPGALAIEGDSADVKVPRELLPPAPPPRLGLTLGVFRLARHAGAPDRLADHEDRTPAAASPWKGNVRSDLEPIDTRDLIDTVPQGVDPSGGRVARQSLLWDPPPKSHAGR